MKSSPRSHMMMTMQGDSGGPLQCNLRVGSAFNFTPNPTFHKIFQLGSTFNFTPSPTFNKIFPRQFSIHTSVSAYLGWVPQPTFNRTNILFGYQNRNFKTPTVLLAKSVTKCWPFLLPGRSVVPCWDHIIWLWMCKAWISRCLCQGEKIESTPASSSLP